MRKVEKQARKHTNENTSAKNVIIMYTNVHLWTSVLAEARLVYCMVLMRTKIRRPIHCGF